MRLAVLLILVAMAGSPVSLGAQADGTPPATELPAVWFSASPDGGQDGEAFRAEIEPGSSQTLTIVIANEGSAPVELRSFTANTRTAPNGGISLHSETQELVEPATWLNYEPDVVALEPGEAHARDFTVTVPDGTAAGEYVGAIAVETVNATEVASGASLLQKTRKVLPVLITVPGDLHRSFTLGEPWVDPSSTGGFIRVPLHNTGNLRLQPMGELVLVDAEGTEVLRSPIVMQSVIAGHETTVEVYMAVMPPPGEYQLTLTLQDRSSDASASLDRVPLTMPEPLEAFSSTVEVVSATVTPNADPIQFAQIAVELNNFGDDIQAAKLTMSVSRNGEFVEDFVLADQLRIPNGPTTIEQRYIPLTGFEAGEWTFSLLLEAIDPATGQVTTLVSQENVATLEVP